MNKFSAILLAIVLTGSVAFAQHINEVTSDGNNNNVYIDQEFSGGPMVDGNEAYVKQLGNTNDVNVYQTNNGYAGVGTWSDVKQTGDRNEADVDQLNDGHISYINSNGNDNYAKTFQHGNKNTSDVDQDGNVNIANNQTYGITNNAEIKQDGNANNSYQELGQGWSFSVQNSEFIARQLGNNNAATQTMDGQEWPGSIDAVNNIGWLEQDGDRNTAIQDMNIGGGGSNNLNNNAWLKQMGNDNYSSQTMAGDGNMSTVKQFGNMNNSVSLQN